MHVLRWNAKELQNTTDLEDLPKPNMIKEKNQDERLKQRKEENTKDSRIPTHPANPENKLDLVVSEHSTGDQPLSFGFNHRDPPQPGGECVC